MKKEINILENSHLVLSKLSQGILLTTKVRNQINTMTIGWGTIGIEWREPVFIAFVRLSRHTKEMLDEAGEFTINVPNEQTDQGILAYCGTRSGRDTDKIQDLQLTLVESDTIQTPGIKELPLTLECKILYSQAQDYDLMPESVQKSIYSHVDPEQDKTGQDVHTMYIAKIQKAYIII